MNVYSEREPVSFGMLLCIVGFVIPVTLNAQPVYDILAKNQETSEFAQAIQKAGLDARLNSDGPYTIFAPSNAAFRRIGGRLNQNNTPALRKFILNHILTGMATKRHISAMSKAPTLGGLTLRIQENNSGNVSINEVAVSRYNIRAQNGIIHIIDGVLE